MPSKQTLIKQAKTAIQNGDKQHARVLLQEAIRQDVNDYQTWLLLAGVTESAAQSLEYIERAEMLNPQAVDVAKARRWAEKRLEKSQKNLGRKPTESSSKRSWQPFMWAAVGFVLLFGMGTAVFILAGWIREAD